MAGTANAGTEAGKSLTCVAVEGVTAWQEAEATCGVAGATCVAAADCRGARVWPCGGLQQACSAGAGCSRSAAATKHSPSSLTHLGGGGEGGGGEGLGGGDKFSGSGLGLYCEGLGL